MSISTKKVLLCMGASGELDNKENQYKTFLLKEGFKCDILQVIDFDFINLDELRTHLLNSDSYEGLILTSPRAAIAIAMIKAQQPFCMESWLKLPTFCIGPTTEMVAREQVGLVNIKGTSSGNARNLASFIINSKKEKSKKSLLLPCSNIARNTITELLAKENINVKKIIVYKTKAHEYLEKALNETLKQSPHILVFFSPSIVDNMLSVLKNQKNVLENFKIIAIGPVTEEALLSNGIHVDAIAEKPEPRALTDAIQKVT